MEDQITNEDRFYASKPLACSSPIVEVRNGSLVRVHDGYKYGHGGHLVEPSTCPITTLQIIKE